MYDLIILGSGPAGLSASIYASRYKISHIVIGSVFDSAVSKAHLIENWPGEEFVKGSDLLMKFYNHAKKLGAKIIQENVIEIGKNLENDSKQNNFIIKTENNKTYESKSILVALGTKNRKLNISGEEEFLGKGVSYCAVCDSAFFKNKVVAVVGGSNSAAMAALMLSEHASRVFLIYRKKPLRCEPIMLERLEKNPKVEIIYNTNVTKVSGNKKVESIELDTEYNQDKNLKLEGLFIEVGSVPFSSLVKGIGIETEKNDCIMIDSSGATNIKGAYAAGDITNGSNELRQIVTAVSEGAVAVTSIYQYLKKN